MATKKKAKKKTVSYWFMKDNHTFIRLIGKTIAEIKSNAHTVASENPYGMVCGATIIEEGEHERRVGKPCHVNGDGEVDLSQWLTDEEIEMLTPLSISTL